MISHKHKCIFIHIPKCAGTSIESKLGHWENFNGRKGQDHRTIKNIENPYIIPKNIVSPDYIIEILRKIKLQYFNKVENPKNKYTVTKKQYKSYFKFTIVRNPWSRAFSWYNNVIRDSIHLNKYGISKDISFKKFLILYAGKGALKPQVYWLKDLSGNIPIDFIGRFENLEIDTKNIFKKLNIEQISLPHKIKGTKEDYRKYYDEETNNIIKKVYKEDISLFGYTFDN